MDGGLSAVRHMAAGKAMAAIALHPPQGGFRVHLMTE